VDQLARAQERGGYKAFPQRSERQQGAPCSRGAAPSPTLPPALSPATERRRQAATRGAGRRAAGPGATGGPLAPPAPLRPRNARRTAHPRRQLRRAAPAPARAPYGWRNASTLRSRVLGCRKRCRPPARRPPAAGHPASAAANTVSPAAAAALAGLGWGL